MNIRFSILCGHTLFLAGLGLAAAASAQTTSVESGPAQAVRFATFNISFNRQANGELAAELAQPGSDQPRRIAAIIQTVRPDVILLNEFDYDEPGIGIKGFQQNYLSIGQHGQQPIEYPHVYFAAVNTGVDSGLDLDSDGKTGTGNDAFGYGKFPGQYGMVVLSKFEIDDQNVRTFQKFLWNDMPDALWPMDPATEEPYYPPAAKGIFRLSSKSHWDVPIKVGGQTIHFLVAHPTPPVFDGAEDRNGKRNHDEIRLIADYITPAKSAYIVDDAGKRGGLAEDAAFVIAGDMNADPSDGDSVADAAKQLTDHSLINSSAIPQSEGGVAAAAAQAGINAEHQGDPAYDTGDFNDRQPGNLRLDYCLPSRNLKLKASGIFWPTPGNAGAELVSATDHRLVWVDLEIK